jgi:hypothetical protein
VSFSVRRLLDPDAGGEAAIGQDGRARRQRRSKRVRSSPPAIENWSAIGTRRDLRYAENAGLNEELNHQREIQSAKELQSTNEELET